MIARALRAALISSVAFVGCATDTRDEGEQDEPPGAMADAMAGAMADASVPFQPPSPRPEGPLECANGFLQLAAGFTMVRDFDYVAVREVDGVRSERGRACERASDHEGCLESVAAAFGDSPNLLTIEGDVVRVWPGPAALQLLGAVDTAQEAVYSAMATLKLTSSCGVAAFEQQDAFRLEGLVQPAVVCGPGEAIATVLVDRAGNVEVIKSVPKGPGNGCPAVGRRPEGLRSEHATRGRSALGEHFAAMAHGEAASVPAFAAIAAELVEHRAPRALVAQARAAIRDEQRHARIAGALARRFGVGPTAPVVEPMPLRELEAFALDNAVEGCVFETYAALEASHQAARAADPVIAAALRTIAADETRHAALAFRLARWAVPQLNRGAQRRVRAAQRAAVERLAASATGYAERDLQHHAGLPDAGTASRLVAGLRAELWRA